MLRGDKAGQAGIQMGRADLEWKVKWGSEVVANLTHENSRGQKQTKRKKERWKKITEEEKKQIENGWEYGD